VSYKHFPNTNSALLDLRIPGIMDNEIKGRDNVYNTNLTSLGVRIVGISDNEIPGTDNVYKKESITIKDI
jgi:hypothetical protein